MNEATSLLKKCKASLKLLCFSEVFFFKVLCFVNFEVMLHVKC